MFNRVAQICFFCTLLFAGYTIGFAQDQESRKKLEHNIQLGTGVHFETGSNAKSFHNAGAAFQLFYGLDLSLSDKWSLMPGIGFRGCFATPAFFLKGGDFDGMAYADVSLSLRYHKPASNVFFGMAPAVSYLLVPDTYSVNSDPTSPLDGQETFNRIDFGIRPSVTFRAGRHFQWGVEAHIGVLNAMKQYPEYKRMGTISVHNLLLFCGWHF